MSKSEGTGEPEKKTRTPRAKTRFDLAKEYAQTKADLESRIANRRRACDLACAELAAELTALDAKTPPDVRSLAAAGQESPGESVGQPKAS